MNTGAVAVRCESRPSCVWAALALLSYMLHPR